MPRPLRIQDAGYLHHVISRGNDRQVLFKSSDDFHTYIQFLEEARQAFPIRIYNYVLMDNHIHLLVEPMRDGSLSKAMESVSKNYAKYFNKTYGHMGHVFQGRFKSFIVQEEKYFFACSRYIDLNPVKAHIVSDPKNYLWSGFGTLGYGREPQLKLDPHNLFLNLGANQEERCIAYRALIFNYQGDDLNLLDRRTSILGDREFKKVIKNTI